MYMQVWPPCLLRVCGPYSTGSPPVVKLSCDYRTPTGEDQRTTIMSRYMQTPQICFSTEGKLFFAVPSSFGTETPPKSDLFNLSRLPKRPNLQTNVYRGPYRGVSPVLRQLELGQTNMLYFLSFTAVAGNIKLITGCSLCTPASCFLSRCGRVANPTVCSLVLPAGLILCWHRKSVEHLANHHHYGGHFLHGRLRGRQRTMLICLSQSVSNDTIMLTEDIEMCYSNQSHTPRTYSRANVLDIFFILDQKKATITLLQIATYCRCCFKSFSADVRHGKTPRKNSVKQNR